MEQYRCFGCMQMISEPVCPHCGHPAEGVNFSHQLPVAAVLAGRYYVGRAINQTENALTYIAYDQSREKTVLICEYYPGMAATREGAQVRPGDGFEAGLDSFRREAALLVGAEELAKVSGTVDAFEENGTAYIVADQIRGPGLQQYISRRGGALEAQEALRILRGVVAGVAVLHQGGSAHGAISPDRIVLDPMGGARLLGFGETAGADPAEDVLALSRLICNAIAPGAEASRIPGLTEQQQMALHMGIRPNPQERFSSVVALRRALFGEVTPPAVPPAPLAVFTAPAVEEETAAQILPETPELEAIPSGVLPEMPKTEAVTSEVLPETPELEAIPSGVLPEMPKTEAIPSEVLPAAQESPVPEIPVVEPLAVPLSSMPATEIITEFKVQQPEQPQSEAPQSEVPQSEAPQSEAPQSEVPQSEAPQSEAPQQPESQPVLELPRTEAAPSELPAWDAPPQWQAESQPQWQPDQQWQTPAKKKKSGLGIGIVVGLVVALAAALVAGYFFVHIWKDATCEEPKTCALCGKTEGKALEHVWLAATCEAPETCDHCGKTQGSPLGHDWEEATCETARTCRTCGAVEGSAGGHTWVDATCLEPKFCSTCGKTEGSALGHSWKDATYTDPKTCTRCGETEGNPKGYMEYVPGDFQKFSWGNSDTHAYVFSKPVKGCKGFTLYFRPIFNYNAWIDEWKLMYRDTSGVWHEHTDFTLDTSDYEHEFEFDPKLDIQAIAVVPRKAGGYSYSFSLGVWYLYCTD